MNHLIMALLLTCALFSATSAQSNPSPLIGLLKTRPDGGFGCYMAPLSESNKIASERRYYFLDNDSGGTMNIGGKDIALMHSSSYEAKPLKGKKRFVWAFNATGITVRFDLTVIKTANEGSDVHYDALITVKKGNRNQSVQAQGFCGG